MLGALVLGGTVFAGVAASPAAAASQNNGCPQGDGWFLLPTSAVLPPDVGNSADQNGDGLLCAKTQGNAGGDPSKGGFPAYVWKDNTNPVK